MEEESLTAARMHFLKRKFHFRSTMWLELLFFGELFWAAGRGTVEGTSLLEPLLLKPLLMSAEAMPIVTVEEPAVHIVAL